GVGWQDRGAWSRGAGGTQLHAAQRGPPIGIGASGHTVMGGGGGIWRHAGHARLARDVTGARRRHARRRILAGAAAPWLPATPGYSRGGRQTRPGAPDRRPEEGAA